MLWDRKKISILLLMCLTIAFMHARNYTGRLYVEVKMKELYRNGSLERKHEINRNAPSMESQLVYLYFEKKPNDTFLSGLKKADVEVFENSWRPPNARHPWGYYTARIPAALSMLKQLDAFPQIREIRTAEGQNQLYNDRGRLETGAEILQGDSWGLDGESVRIGIIDSGFEVASLDLNQPEAGIDYSAYPDSDYTISNANTGTGHGTHVAGSILGLGVNSNSVWRGMAPGAEWCAYKVMTDYTHLITDAALNQSYWTAWYRHNCDMLNVSIGGWDNYHDGSGALEQVIDQISEDGCVVFQSAGNEGNDDRHAMGTLAGGSSEFVAINIPDTTSNRGTYLINLVWYDSPDTTIQRPMTLSFYNEEMEPINQIWQDIDDMTQSPRGTQSRWGSVIRNGDNPFFVKVENQSGVTMDYHLFSMSSGAKFVEPDTSCTISSPAVADLVVSVGSWTTRNRWHTWNHLVAWTDEVIGECSPFSSRGPRVDGTQKPELSAPGSYIISIRDDDAWGWPFGLWTTAVISNAYAEGDSTGGLPADYIILHGTSMSSPITCGAAALIKQYEPEISRDELVVLLQNHARLDEFTGDLPNEKFGFGKVDVEAALLALVGDQTPAQVQNITLEISDGNIVLNWDAVQQSINGAPISTDGYRIFASTIPYAPTWNELGETSQTTFSVPVNSGYRFFIITCLNNP